MGVKHKLLILLSIELSNTVLICLLFLLVNKSIPLISKVGEKKPFVGKGAIRSSNSLLKYLLSVFGVDETLIFERGDTLERENSLASRILQKL